MLLRNYIFIDLHCCTGSFTEVNDVSTYSSSSMCIKRSVSGPHHRPLEAAIGLL